MRSKIHASTLFLVMTALFLASSCASLDGYSEGDYFFVRRAGAVMPVWVRGNADSGVTILFLHGGPGGKSMYMNRFSFFQELEARYRVVYWDQRCSGTSQGNPDPDSFTVDSFIDDLDMVVDTVETLYEPQSIFLYGISWGGTLGMAYLCESAHQAKLRGFIEEGGGHNMPLLLGRSSAIILDYARERVAAGEDVEFWQTGVDFFTTRPYPLEWGLEDYRTYNSYLGAARPYEFMPQPAPNEFAGPDAELVFFSPLSFAMFFNQGALIPRFNIMGLDLNPRMGAITLPVFLAWGEYDINSPVDLAYNARDYLGTPAEDLVFHIFPDSGHNPAVDRPAEYLPLFIDFVEAHR